LVRLRGALPTAAATASTTTAERLIHPGSHWSLLSGLAKCRDHEYEENFV
jgi:hypothetical protein